MAGIDNELVYSQLPLSMVINSIRGVYVCVPRNMTQAAGFYNTLFEGEDPALVIEPLNGYRLKEKRPENIGEYKIPLGIPEVLNKGTDVTIVGRNKYLVKNEDPDVSDLLKEELSKRMQVHTNFEVIEVKEKDGLKIAVAKNRETGDVKEFKGEVLLVAAGRRSNTDLLQPEKSGVDVDSNGWVIVDDYFRTNKEGIWSLGDAIGR